MIWSLMFFSFFVIMSKEFLFTNQMMNLEMFCMFLLSISYSIFLIVMKFFKYQFFSDKEKNVYKILMFLVIMASILAFSSSSSFMFLMYIELSTIPMFSLMIYFSKDLEKMYSIIFMIFINMLGSMPFMYFVMNLKMISLKYIQVSNYLSNYNMNSMLTFFCFILILACKVPIMLTHFWLTKAHVTSSASSSMFLASIMLKMGTFGLMKFSSNFISVSMKMMNLILSLSIVSCIFFCLMMNRFFDLKFLIAGSSIIHMSLMVPFITAQKTFSVYSSMLMMIGHGLVSYTLFFLFGVMYEKSMNRSFEFNKAMESVSPILNIFVFMFFFMNLGFPPFINFFSEMYTASFLIEYSLNFTMFFFINLTLSIIFLMMMLTKNIFGKKMMMSLGKSKQLMYQASWVFLIKTILVIMLI